MNPSFTVTALIPAEEIQSRMLREFRDASCTHARNHALAAICTEFGPFVRLIARSHWRRAGRINQAAGLADIEAAGRLGLLSAARRWDPGFGKAFVHFASRWISGSCKSEVRQLAHGAVSIPQKVRRLCREYRRTAGHEREDILLKSHSRNSTKLVVRYLSQAESDHPLPLLKQHPDGSVSETLSIDAPSAAVQAELTEQVAKIRSVLLRHCSARDRLIFFLHFPHWPIAEHEIGEVTDKIGDPIVLAGIDLPSHAGSYVAIAGLLRLTRERVRQIHGATLMKLRLAVGSA